MQESSGPLLANASDMFTGMGLRGAWVTESGAAGCSTDMVKRNATISANRYCSVMTDHQNRNRVVFQTVLEIQHYRQFTA